jgi:hypothetical protein
VIARPESWSRPADGRFAVVAAIVAAAAFAGSWSLLHHGFYSRVEIVDTPVYWEYGNRLVYGDVPYRANFPIEYPPAALPVFAIPSIGRPVPDFDGYRRVFERLMLGCGLAAIGFAAYALASLRAEPLRVGGALTFVALAPLALGSVILSRFDLWPTALMAGGVAFAVAGRGRIGSGMLALGAAAKIFPALLIPPVLVYVWRRRGRREGLVCAGVVLAVLAACFVPFAVLAPHGLWDSLHRQGSRPLQIESLGSSLLLAGHQLFGLGITMKSSSGSQNLAGSLPHAVELVQTVVQPLAVVALWVAFARGPADRERLVRYVAATLVAFVAFGKVLSPQFMIWLVPLVPLVRGRRGLAASALLGAALLLTQSWFPFRYWDLVLHFAALPSWLVVSRNLVLVALLAVLALPALRPTARARARARS